MGLSEHALGLALFGFSENKLSALLLVGGSIAQFGSHKVTLFTH
jgi:hypothetical protein